MPQDKDFDPQDADSAKIDLDDMLGSESNSDSEGSKKSWGNKNAVISSGSIELMAMKSQLNSSKVEIESLKRRNADLETLLKEKEQLIQDVVIKFKCERDQLKKENRALKSRILKIEQQRNDFEKEQE